MVLFLYLNDSDQESLLILLMHRSTDGSNGPAQCVEVLPGPFSAIDLVMKLLCHYSFCVSIIQMSEVHCRRAQQELRDRHKQRRDDGDRLIHHYPRELLLYR